MLIRASLFIPITLLLVACESATDVQVINTEPMQWLLPPALNEASGLALADNGSVYIHNDELGEIYRFIPRSNSILKVASISWPPVGEDFEGIAVHQDSLFLITSDSQLFEVSDFSARENHQVVGARRIATGLQAVCEFEGLYNLDGKLLMPCKNLKVEQDQYQLRVFAFDIETEAVSEFLVLDRNSVAGINQVAATAFEATDTHYFVVFENYLVKIDRGNLKSEVITLNNKLHQQVEGIALLPDGALMLVEDNRRGLARLTRYTSLDELIRYNH